MVLVVNGSVSVPGIVFSGKSGLEAKGRLLLCRLLGRLGDHATCNF